MEHRKIYPTINRLNVSQSRSPNFYAFITKLYLDKFKTVELHSMGYAMNTAIKASEILKKYGYVTYKKVSTDELNELMKPRLIIELDKTPDFDKKVKEFNKNYSN